jgi:outer membrane protein assembly factor BamB
MILSLSAHANFFSRLKSSVSTSVSSEGAIDGAYLTAEEKGRPSRKISARWSVDLDQKIHSKSWIGTTYRDKPYTEEEFYALREREVANEVERLKQEHISKKKAEITKESGVIVEDLLDDLLGGDDEEEEEEDLSKYLEGYDEESVRLRVSRRTFIPQSRAVVIPALYVQGENNELFCLELETGLAVWVLKLDAPLEHVPYESDSHLYIVEGVQCKVVDKRSGFVADRVRFDRAIHPRVFSYDGMIFAVSYQGHLMGWDLNRNFPDWTVRLADRAELGVFGHDNGLFIPVDGGFSYSFSFNGAAQWKFSSKAESDEKIYLEKERNKHIKAMEAEGKSARIEGRSEDKEYMNRQERAIDLIDDKKAQLAYRTRGNFVSAPDFVKDALFVGNTDFQFYRLDLYSGIPEWVYPCSGEVRSAPVAADSFVWQLDRSGVLHKVDAESGSGEAIASSVAKVVMASDDWVTYWSVKGDLRLSQNRKEIQFRGLNRSTGSVLGDVDSGLLINIGKEGGIFAYALKRPLLLN